MWSNLIPLLQSEEGCPKGGVVGEKEFLILMINRFFIVLPTTSPYGYSSSQEEENEGTTANHLPPVNYHLFACFLYSAGLMPYCFRNRR